MKTLVKLLFFVVCLGLINSCSEPDEFLDESPEILKKGKIMVRPSTNTDVHAKAEEDWNSINDALQSAKSGEVVQLAEGLFYLHKSIIRWDFNGTLRGSGMGKTTIQTVPGKLFDVSKCPKLEWSSQSDDGFFMFCFPHHSNGEERTVLVSDLSIVVDEETTPFYRLKGSPNEAVFNTLQAINVYYENIDKDMANPIHLNVLYKNISLTGEKDAGKYKYNGFSMFSGLAAYGASSGIFEAKNVHIENASGCITPHYFCRENSTVTIKNSSVNSCKHGVYSRGNRSWAILDNDIENSQIGLSLLKGLHGNSFVKDNRIHFMGSGGLGVMFTNNVQVKDNVFEGYGNFGIASRNGDNWIIKGNDLCGVYANLSPIVLNGFFKNSEIKNNAKQDIGGPGATDPTNIIGEGRECDD